MTEASLIQCAMESTHQQAEYSALIRHSNPYTGAAQTRPEKRMDWAIKITSASRRSRTVSEELLEQITNSSTTEITEELHHHCRASRTCEPLLSRGDRAVPFVPTAPSAGMESPRSCTERCDSVPNLPHTQAEGLPFERTPRTPPTQWSHCHRRQPPARSPLS